MRHFVWLFIFRTFFHTPFFPSRPIPNRATWITPIIVDIMDLYYSYTIFFPIISSNMKWLSLYTTHGVYIVDRGWVETAIHKVYIRASSHLSPLIFPLYYYSIGMVCVVIDQYHWRVCHMLPFHFFSFFHRKVIASRLIWYCCCFSNVIYGFWFNAYSFHFCLISIINLPNWMGSMLTENPS